MYAPWPQIIPKKLPPPMALIHGGLGAKDGRFSREHLLEVLQKVGISLQKKLKKPALEIAVEGVKVLEDAPEFNAGFGSKLQRDGVARLSAAVMDGASQKIAGVSNIEGLRHPIEIARKLLMEKDRLLTGKEASQFAFAKGFEPSDVVSKERLLEWEKKIQGVCGTVGCISLDLKGNTAAATSTGGRGGEMPGRMSDSGTPAGNFANPFGAVSCTGIGEQILDTGLAVAICARLEDGYSLQKAVALALKRHHEKALGLIALNSKGEGMVQATSGHLAYAIVTTKYVHTGLSFEDWT